MIMKPPTLGALRIPGESLVLYRLNGFLLSSLLTRCWSKVAAGSDSVSSSDSERKSLLFSYQQDRGASARDGHGMGQRLLTAGRGRTGLQRFH